MKNEEIMTNEVMEEIEETVETTMNDSGNALKTLGMIGGALLIGGLAYKYAVKPIIRKIENSKNINEEDIVDDDLFETEFNESENFEEE